MNHGFSYTNRIDASTAGVSVLEFYASRYRHSTAEVWEKRIADGHITRNGALATPSMRLDAGDVLVYHRPGWTEPEVPTEVPVLHDDAHMIVFNKPAGLPVLPGGGYLDNTLLALARTRHGAALAPVQRLDRGTSGVIVFARTREAAALLSAAFREKRVSKSYLAIVHGTEVPASFVVETPRRTGTGVAISRCSVLWRDPTQQRSLLQVDTSTGDTHQIRRHCALAGWPLAGDPLYDVHGMITDEDTAVRQGLTGATGFLLHAWRISLPHPESGTMIILEAECGFRSGCV